MPIFSYKAYNESGQVESGSLETSDADTAKAELKKRGLSVVTIKVTSDNNAFAALLKRNTVNLDDLEFLTSELAILLESGVKIDKGLSIVSRGNKSQAVNTLLNEVSGKLKSGESLAKAFDTKQKVFNSLYLSLIEIGEKSGQLTSVFAGLARDLQFRKALLSKVRQALTYPSIILLVCVACILFVFNYIVPQMSTIFSESDNIPAYTSMLIATSEWMIKYQLWVFASAIFIGIVTYRQRHTPGVKSFIERYSLRMPFISSIIVQVERIRFNSAMALMLNAGIKVDNAIDLAANSVNHPSLRRSLVKANENIKKGASISSSLGATPIYPLFFISLLEVGEESGNLSKIFEEIATRSKSDFEHWTDKVTSILEPLLILVMGGIVGSIVITMLLSVVSVNDIAI